MMLDVAPLVRDMAPGLLGPGAASVACIATTRHKYLVFDAGAPARPSCVVEYGDRERLQRTERILSTLSARLPGVVPSVICCAPCDDGRYVLIQQGLHGVPWFRVADTVNSAAEWRSLLDRSLDVMLALHEAIRGVPVWNASVDLSHEIERQMMIAQQTGVPLPPTAQRMAQQWARSHAQTPPSFWQHGDFSLNNLLVGDESIAVIDFDEFGSTTMPLHDAFGLGLSFALSQSTGGALSRLEVLHECIRRGSPAARVDARLLPGLLLHHLLLRINQCHGLHRRARLRRTLLDWAEALARTPEIFLS